MRISRDQDLVKAARLAINNGQRDAEAQALLLKHDFGPEQWQTGRQLTERVEHIIRHRQGQQEARWGLSQQIDASVHTLIEGLKEHAQVARLAFRHDPVLLHALAVDRIAPRRWEAVDQAAHFYGYLDRHKVSLQAFGLNPKQVKQIIADIGTLLDQQEERVHRTGRAQHSTQEKKAAVAALRTWLLDFRDVARVAFRRQPQLREIFGIRVRSSVKSASVPVATDSQ